MNTANTKYLSIEFLRSAAALAVCWSHFGVHFWGDAVQTLIGRVGVILFFVISGLVIPASLERGEHRLRDLGSFLLRRTARLYPAFLFTIALILALCAAKTVLLNQPTPLPGIRQLIGNLLLCPVRLGIDYLVPVFWTLTVEWQYYVFIALLFPLLRRAHGAALGLICAVLLLASRHPGEPVALLPWLPAFVAGIGFWLLRSGRLTPAVFLMLETVSFGALTLRKGWPAALLFSLLILAPVRGRPLATTAAFLGAISYPLYLLHVPIGAEISLRAWRWTGDNDAGVLAQAVIILVVCLAASCIVFHFIDRPAMLLADYLRRLRLIPATIRS